MKFVALLLALFAVASVLTLGLSIVAISLDHLAREKWPHLYR